MNILEKKYNKRKKQLIDSREQERQSLRYQKAIKETAKRILEKDDKRLSYKDWEQIALNLGGTVDKIRITRLKRHMTTDIAKRDINQTIRLYLLEKGYNEAKIHDLIAKAENEAKSTKDYLDIIKQIKELITDDAPKVQVSESREYSNFSDFREDKPSKVKQSISTSASIDNDNKTDLKDE